MFNRNLIGSALGPRYWSFRMILDSDYSYSQSRNTMDLHADLRICGLEVSMRGERLTGFEILRVQV